MKHPRDFTKKELAASKEFTDTYITIGGRPPHRPDVMQYCFLRGVEYAGVEEVLNQAKKLAHALDKSLPAGTWFHLGPYGSSPEVEDYRNACATLKEFTKWLGERK